MASTNDNFKEAADRTFAKLKVAFQHSNNFWQLGHSFDTIIDYFVNCPDPGNDPGGFAKIALDRYVASLGTACWYDDYGWWGIAALKASQHSGLLGSAAQFTHIAGCCWNTMDNNAPKVWEKADKRQFEELRPRFEGGAWNFDWRKDGDPNAECGQRPCNPLDKSNTLCGYQNTVTNGLYLVLAARLYEATKNRAYLDAANREYSFLNQWFNVPEQHNSLLNRLSAGKVVVRERVSTYAMARVPVYNYRPDLAWAGDQGLILGGVVDLMRISGRGSPNYNGLLTIAQEIAAGVKDYLVGEDGLLLSWKPDPAPGNDRDDYNTGIGVYMRYLLHAYQNNDDMKTYLRRIGYPDFVLTNARHTVQHPSSDMVGLTNDLAILVAAIVMV